MDVTATTKYLRISPTKVRDLARAIQGLPVPRALQVTETSHRKGALYIGKTLKSAIANAENNAGLSAEKLIVKQATVDQGPTVQRWRYGARGMSKPFLRRTSHVKIVLSDGAKEGDA